MTLPPHPLRTLAVWPLLAAATLAPFAAATAQGPLPLPPLAGTRLDVVAQGEATRVPDIAEIGAGVVTQAPTAGAAMSENATRMAAVIAALKKAGVAARDIRTSALSLNPQYQYGENQPPRLNGYQASNQVTVQFRDIKRAGAIIDALVAQGANQVNGPAMRVDQPEAALDEARTAAVARARARADLYARAAGLRVKRILAISEGDTAPPVYPMPMMAMRAEKAADTAIEPGEQKLTATITVSFELE